MNKLFTLIGAAALMAAVGAQAQETTTIYSATVNSDATALVETGGKCKLSGASLAPQSSIPAIKFGATDDRGVIELTDGAQFNEGDIISFTGFIKNSATTKSAVVKILLDDAETTYYPTNDLDESDKHKGFANLDKSGYNYVDGQQNTLTITIAKDATKVSFARNSGATGSATTMNITAITVTRGNSTSIESAEAGAPVSVEYYNVAGARVDGLQPGINIVRTTYEGGKVVTSKVRR